MKKKTIQTILLIDVVAIIVCVLIFLFAVKERNADGISLINSISIYGTLLAAVIAIFYILVGCNKKYGAVLYKIFFNIFALIELVSLANINSQTSLSAMMIAIRFACLIMLSHSIDLGAKRTKIVGHILLATSIIEIVQLIVIGVFIYAWKGFLIELILEITSLLFVMAKYIDKKERGSL